MSEFLSHFVKRPILVFMITVTILVMGAVALSHIPLTLLPEGMIGSNRINMWIPTRNMTPQEGEEQVYAPLEGKLLTIPGITASTGYCFQGGVRVFAELATRMDMKLAAAEVRDRLERARASWPAHVDRWYTWRETAETLPMFFFHIGIPDSDQKWYDLVDSEIKPKLEALEGVGEVSIWGMVGQTVRIFFDRDKLSQLRVNFQGVLESLGNDNVTLPIGQIREGESRYLVRADLLYHDLDEVRDLPIGNGLKIRDVARVEKVRGFRDRVSRVDGKVALSGMIRKQAGANTVATSARVRGFFEEIQKDPKYAGIVPLWDFDKGKFIQNTVGTLENSAMIGGILAFLVLFLFLRRIRMTLVITLSLPISLLAAITLLYFRGDSLNIFTMTSITLSLGMLVDNSVVVLENIDRLRKKGLGWFESCAEGVKGVGNAVSLATLTTVAIFVPVMFFSSNPNVQQQAFSMCLPLIIALIASLFVAMVLLPATIAFMNRRDASRVAFAGVPPVATLGRRLWTLRERQIRFVGWVVDHRKLSMLGTSLLLVGLYFLQSMLLESDVRMGHSGTLSVSWEYPKGTTLPGAAETSGKLEQWVYSYKEKWGFTRVSARFDRKDGFIRVRMPGGTTDDDMEAVVKEMREALPEYPGIEPVVRARGVSNDEATEGNRGFTVELSGRNSDHLREWALDLKQELLAKGLAETVDLGRTSSQEEIRINVDRNRTQELGVEPNILFGFVSYGLSGQRVSRYHQTDGPELDLIAEFDGSADMELKDLKEMKIWSRTSGYQRLGDMAAFEFTEGYGSVRRRNGVLTTVVAGNRPEEVTMLKFQKGLAEIAAAQNMPRGYKYSLGGRFRRQSEWQAELMVALMVGVLFVFLVMGFFFESVPLPLAVIGTVPLAILGGLTGMSLFGFLFEPMVIFGLMILAGVIVNNGIVLLDHIVKLRREEGMERREAILNGVRDRIRPIFMTASTTIVGLLPMAFTKVEGNEGISYAAMSVVVASGLFFATFLTPFVVPLAYTLLDDLSLWFMRIVRFAARGSRATARSDEPLSAPAS